MAILVSTSKLLFLWPTWQTNKSILPANSNLLTALQSFVVRLCVSGKAYVSFTSMLNKWLNGWALYSLGIATSDSIGTSGSIERILDTHANFMTNKFTFINKRMQQTRSPSMWNHAVRASHDKSQQKDQKTRQYYNLEIPFRRSAGIVENLTLRGHICRGKWNEHGECENYYMPTLSSHCRNLLNVKGTMQIGNQRPKTMTTTNCTVLLHSSICWCSANNTREILS